MRIRKIITEGGQTVIVTEDSKKHEKVFYYTSTRINKSSEGVGLIRNDVGGEIYHHN